MLRTAKTQIFVLLYQENSHVILLRTSTEYSGKQYILNEWGHQLLILFLEILLMKKAHDYRRIRMNPIMFFLEENLSYRQMDSKTPQHCRPAERLKVKRLPFYLMQNNLWLGLFSLAEWTAQLFSVTKMVIMEDEERNSIL